VLYQGRTEGMNQWKSAHAVKTDKRTLAEAVVGADVLLGLSAKGAFTPEMIASMAPNPDHLRHGQSRSGDHAGGGPAVRNDAIMAPAAATIPTRSTTSWASPTSSAARSTCAPAGSTTR
jgi:malate dehydrogenase (oxaloacetate-decarboxylating)(NADP+)